MCAAIFHDDSFNRDTFYKSIVSSSRSFSKGNIFPEYFYKTSPRLSRMVDSYTFQGTVCVLIILNTILMAWEANEHVSHPDVAVNPLFMSIGLVFTSLFLVELGLRIAAARCNFFTGDGAA